MSIWGMIALGVVVGALLIVIVVILGEETPRF